MHRAANGLRGRVTAGPHLLHDLGERLDELNRLCGVQTTQRRLWLQTWLDINPGATIWAASVSTADRLVAALVLHETTEAQDVRVIRALCPRGDDRLVPAVAHRDAGDELARTVAREVLGRRDSWFLSLGPVPDSDPFLQRLQTHLPGSRLVPGRAIPLVLPATNHYCSADSPCPRLAANMQRNLRKARNRLAADGLAEDVRVITDPQEMSTWLGRIWQLRCDRDAFVGRLRPDPGVREQRFWHNSLSAHSLRGGVELSLLHIGGQLAAYVLALTDETTCRVLEGRFVDEFARFNPGRLLEAHVVRRAVCDDGRRLDWMNGVAPEKLVAATSLESTSWLYASA